MEPTFALGGRGSPHKSDPKILHNKSIRTPAKKVFVAKVSFVHGEWRYTEDISSSSSLVLGVDILLRSRVI